jgi:hypothetical protein
MQYLPIVFFALIIGCAHQMAPRVKPALHAEPMLTLDEDRAGHVLQTHSFKVFEDGLVFEEFYDFVSGGDSHWHAPNRHLSHAELATIDAAISRAKFNALPKQLWRSGYFDAPGRFVSLSRDGQNKVVNTDDIWEKVEDPMELRFRVLWHEVIRIIENSHTQR